MWHLESSVALGSLDSCEMLQKSREAKVCELQTAIAPLLSVLLAQCAKHTWCHWLPLGGCLKQGVSMHGDFSQGCFCSPGSSTFAFESSPGSSSLRHCRLSLLALPPACNSTQCQMWGGGAAAHRALGALHGDVCFIISAVHRKFPLVFQNGCYGEQKLQAHGNKLKEILKQAAGRKGAFSNADKIEWLVGIFPFKSV